MRNLSKIERKIEEYEWKIDRLKEMVVSLAN